MSAPTATALAATLVLGLATASPAADSHVGAKHRQRHVYRADRVEPIAPPPTFSGGRLVLNPALNIACNKRDRGARALPCDQPVWVYGDPCEVDEGEGYFRACGQPPGVGRYDRWNSGYR